MKCSYQSVYNFDQASLQIEKLKSGYESGRFVLVQAECVFQRVPLQITSRTDSTRNVR